MLAFFISGVLVLWLLGVSFVLIANRENGSAVPSAVAAALGWPVVLVPWREWCSRESLGAHRLMRS